MWEPEAGHGEIRRGRPRQIYPNKFLRDVGINSKEELRTLMRAGLYGEGYLQWIRPSFDLTVVVVLVS
jgi:hypothetical protein